MKTIEVRALMNCRCLAARRSAREITRLYDRHLRPHGLRATQFSVLVALAVGEAMPVGRLAEAIGAERTTLTRSTAVLERRGWIQSDFAEDARVRSLRLTPAGRKKLESAIPGWKAAQKAAERLEPRSKQQ